MRAPSATCLEIPIEVVDDLLRDLLRIGLVVATSRPDLTEPVGRRLADLTADIDRVVQEVRLVAFRNALGRSCP